jgi:hypothetical protein
MKVGAISLVMAVAAILFVGGGGAVPVEDTSKPSGLNPITYPLAGTVNAGNPVTITWKVL